METDILQLLIDTIPTKSLESILCRIMREFKKFRISGFTNLSKVPIPLLKSNLSKNTRMAQDFLVATEAEFLDVAPDLDNTSLEELSDLKNLDNQLGIAAYCLLRNKEEFSSFARTILENYESPSEPHVDISETNHLDALKHEREKTDRYKKKFQDMKKQYDALKSDLDSLQSKNLGLESDVSNANNIISGLRDKNLDLTIQIKALHQTISEIKKENKALKTERDSRLCCRKKGVGKLACRVLAVGCYDAIKSFSDIIQITCFDPFDPTPIEDTIKNFDQIWIISNQVPFSVNRKLKNLDLRQRHKAIHFFVSYQELIEYADEICNRS